VRLASLSPHLQQAFIGPFFPEGIRSSGFFYAALLEEKERSRYFLSMNMLSSIDQYIIIICVVNSFNWEFKKKKKNY
jgi:hypothetical protein